MVTRDRHTPVIAVLGLGEAGSVIARDLVAAGVRVRGYDPAVTAAEPIIDTASEAEAACGAHLVLSVNRAKAAVDAFKAGLTGLRQDEGMCQDVLWADLNTASPGTKRHLAELAGEAGNADRTRRAAPDGQRQPRPARTPRERRIPTVTQSS